jgi:flagellar biosynthesis chaperone FliJ
MTRITLSLSKKEIQRLKDIASKEERPLSRQVVYMMNHYVETVPNLKNHLDDKEKERR